MFSSVGTDLQNHGKLATMPVWGFALSQNSLVLRLISRGAGSNFSVEKKNKRVQGSDNRKHEIVFKLPPSVVRSWPRDGRTNMVQNVKNERPMLIFVICILASFVSFMSWAAVLRKWAIELKENLFKWRNYKRLDLNLKIGRVNSSILFVPCAVSRLFSWETRQERTANNRN